jgi:hypothetical protein
VAWIGSIQAFLLLLVGVITGPVYDAGYFRHLIISGAFLIPFGFMMTSLAKTYWQTMLAQALCIGLGNGGKPSLFPHLLLLTRNKPYLCLQSQFFPCILRQEKHLPME